MRELNLLLASAKEIDKAIKLVTLAKEVKEIDETYRLYSTGDTDYVCLYSDETGISYRKNNQTGIVEGSLK